MNLDFGEKEKSKLFDEYLLDLNPNETSPQGMNFFTGFETGDKIRAVLCFSKLVSYR